MAGPVLVTGAAGFAGSHLVDLLATSEDPIMAWCRPGGRGPREVPHTAWEAIDLLDRDAVRTAIARARPRAVYHCAGAAHVAHSWDRVESTFAANVRGTHNLFDALLAEQPDARVLLTSSSMVYATADEPLAEEDRLAPGNPYGLSKLAQELLAEHTPRLPILIARPFNHCGPRQDPFFVASSFARRIADIEAGRWESEIAVGNLDARRDLTDVRDTVRAYRLILERGEPGRAYNVCSGRAMAIRELLDRMLTRARVPIPVRIDPARFRPNDIPLVVGNPARITRELGWAPQIPFDRTLDDLLDYWRANPAWERPLETA